MTKVYISGPITGTNGYELRFSCVERWLCENGFSVINPVKISKAVLARNPNAEWVDFMRKDIKMLLDCDNIIMLPGWENSKGAKLEFIIAHALSMKIDEFTESMMRELENIRDSKL